MKVGGTGASFDVHRRGDDGRADVDVLHRGLELDRANHGDVAGRPDVHDDVLERHDVQPRDHREVPRRCRGHAAARQLHQTAGAGTHQHAGRRAVPGRGGTAATASGSAILTWQPPASNIDGSPLTDLAAFKVYWGTAHGTYSQSTHISNAAARTHTVTGLARGTWHFVVTALNSQGVESVYSSGWSKIIQ